MPPATTISRKKSGFNPVEQEVVFVTISVLNGCEYCTAAHSFIADKMSKVPAEVTDAIRNGEEIPDARLKALSQFTRLLSLTCRIHVLARPARNV